MDSIERMRRINDLTKELKQHGFAESSFEAIQQANQIYGSDDVDDAVKHGMISKSAHERMMKDEKMDDENTVYNDKKLAKITENLDVLTGKMNEIIRAINDLDARLTELKSKHDKLAAAKPTMVAEPKADVKMPTNAEDKAVQSEAPSVSREEHSQHSQAQKKDDYDFNQRTGNFQSQDVAIDKMFYFGNKK
ncbi:MAG: hypothetical protein ACP5OA_03895 [Candidatus Woesearchaeota archaeon]